MVIVLFLFLSFILFFFLQLLMRLLFIHLFES